jgi:hypothetical protein
MNLLNKFLDFLLFFGMFGLMWIGAEWVFEGAVHTSDVDTVVCAMLARCCQKMEATDD